MIKTFVVNPIEENCYIFGDATGDAVIIDCGALTKAEQTQISSFIAAEGLRPVAHLLTHAHFDHLFGAEFLYDTYGLKPRFAAADAEIYAHAEMLAEGMFGCPVNFVLPPAGDAVDADTIIPFGTHTLTVIPTPGHTPGGVCYYCADEGILFSGDTLFRSSIGRTDLPGGNYTAILESLHTLTAQLPDDVRVLPGHGPASTIAFERRVNPYIRG